jgi:hypothetical protein
MNGVARRSLACCAAATSIAVAAVLGPVAPAHSTPPVHVAFPVDVSYEIQELTELCGVEVWFRLEGTFKGILFKDKGGVINGEFDSQPNTWATMYSPETGLSFRNPFATTFHYEYPDGVSPGDRAVVTATGFLEKIPGLPARAGRAVFPDGEVLFLDDGVPIVDFGEPARQLRSTYSFDDADAAICVRLRGD